MKRPARVSETKMVHGAMDFPENSILVGYRIYEEDDKGEPTQKTLYLFRDGSKWVLEKNVSSITIENQRYVILPSFPPFLDERWSTAQLNAFLDVI